MRISSSRQRLLASTVMFGALVAAVPAFAQTTSPTNTPTSPNASTSPSPDQPRTPAEQGLATDPSAAGQTGPADTTPAPQVGQTTAPRPGGGSTVQGVVVTGSRIRRNEFTAPDPIQVITAEQATLQGVANTAQLLQQQPLATVSFQTNNQLTGFVTNGGPGSQQVSLRGLGSNRTLVLVNGRRVGPAGTRGQVGPADLNTIPQSLIERVEILKDGASSIYGSDAVAGVVNIILKNKNDGGVLTAFGTSSEHGGGNEYLLGGQWGSTFNRGYFNIAAEYNRVDPLRRRQRDDTKCAADYLFDPASHTTRIDYTNPYSDKSLYKCFNQSNNYLATSNFGNIYYRVPGVIYPNAAQGNNVPATISSTFARWGRAGFPLTYPYAPYENLFWDNATVVSPAKRYTLAANGAFNLTPDIEAYTELVYNRRDSEQNGSRQYFPNVSAANPNAQAVFAGTGVTPLFPVIPLPSNTEQRVDYYRAVLGVRGAFTGLGYLDRFNYDVYGQYSHNSGKYLQDIIFNDRTLAVTGALACNPNVTPNISGYNCSALPNGVPWYSPRVLSGQFNDAERAFLFAKEGGHTTYNQAYVEGILTGDIITLPAGPVGAAVGFQLRHESIDDNPDRDLAQSNLWGQTSAGRTKGSDTIKELFAETTVPIFKAVPFFDSLTFQASGRITDYKSYGSNSTYKLGLNWQIIPDVRLRGTYGTSFRAPALYELYLANQSGFLGQTSIDPCINYANGNNPTIAKNCASQGIPGDYTGVQNPGGGSSAIVFTGGGKGLLKAETSTAKTVGIVLTPQFIKPFADISIAVDYVDINVENEVRTFGAANIITQCYSAANFPNSPYCTLFTRELNPASPNYFNILTVNNNYINVANQVSRGIDLTVRIQKNIGPGRFTLDGTATWTTKDVTTLIGGTAPNDYNGTTYNFRGPDFGAFVSARYDTGPWTYYWNVRMIGKGSDTEQVVGDVFPFSRYGDVAAGRTSNNCAAANNQCVYFKQYTEFTAYHTASIRRRFEGARWVGNMTLQAGVQNVFDERPPAQSNGQFRVGTAALNAYDMVGRRFFINLTKGF